MMQTRPERWLSGTPGARWVSFSTSTVTCCGPGGGLSSRFVDMGRSATRYGGCGTKRSRRRRPVGSPSSPGPNSSPALGNSGFPSRRSVGSPPEAFRRRETVCLRERGSDIGVLTFTVLQLGLESAGVVAYLFGLFLYAIAAAVVLPIPVELLLLLYPEINPAVKAIALGLGKAVGAVVVFFVGNKVNPYIERWMDRHPIGKRVLKLLEAFVRRTGAIGLAVLLAIPFMSDTAVNYFYSLLNEEGHAIGRWHFVLANLIGGVGPGYPLPLLRPRCGVGPPPLPRASPRRPRGALEYTPRHVA